MALSGAALQLMLCLVLWVKGAYRQFRAFSLYTAISALTTPALLAVQNHPSIYSWVYWITEAISVVLIFAALQESVYLVFRNFLSIHWFRLLFPGIGLLMLVIALLRAASHPVSQARLWASAIISLEIGVGFLQFGLFLLFIVLVRFFQMRWRQQAFGVVLGFGISVAGSLVAFLVRSEFGTKSEPVVRFTPPIAYIMAVVVWLATFLRAEPLQPGLDRAPALTPEQMASDLRRYTQAVKGILER
ncbi:MAG TPA: hypothetical protein VIB39_01560 [Candidatus Angelobacter sp.]